MQTNLLTIVVEKSDDALWGRLQTPEYLAVTCGQNLEEIRQNIYDLILDHYQNEGKEDEFFVNLAWNTLSFEFVYDLSAFFEEYSSLKMSKIAQLAGINSSLLRQYAAGIKHPSSEQVQKIELAIHTLGDRLLSVRLT
ncbi:MAG: hypothetical protein MUE85_08425 [Microscillaceae bacterium]|jgi:hypothetical protein|nr:hypothetical protein [Microscillaceae bacterium]